MGHEIANKKKFSIAHDGLKNYLKILWGIWLNLVKMIYRIPGETHPPNTLSNSVATAKQRRSWSYPATT